METSLVKTGTFWQCDDYPRQVFRCYAVGRDAAHLRDGVIGTSVSVPIASMGSRWRSVRVQVWTSGQLGVDA